MLKGLAPAAERYLDEEGGGEEESPATILPDGTIDVTPIDRKKVKMRAKEVVQPFLALCTVFFFSLVVLGVF